MKSLKTLIVTLCFVLAVLPLNTSGEKKKKARVCKAEVFSALRSLPRLEYACGPDENNDSDERILKMPGRVKAIKDYTNALERLTDREWWAASVEDLNVCYFRGKPGALSAEESAKFEGGDYQLRLFGNNQIRLVIASDPCYQRSYGGSNLFLLYRAGQTVRATQVLDGYYSRADNSVELDFATTGAEQIVEVSTSTGGLNPYVTNYYFTIDKRSQRVVPKNLFKDERGLTNRITSAMILGELKGQGSTQSSPEMRIIRRRRLARAFHIYRDDADGKINDNGRSLTRTVYTWNGHFYAKAK